MIRLGGQVPTFGASVRGRAEEATGAPAGAAVVPVREGDATARRGGVEIPAPGTGPAPAAPESSAAAQRRADLQGLLDDAIRSRQQIQEELEAARRLADEGHSASTAIQARMEAEMAKVVGEMARVVEENRTLRASAASAQV